jgi:hypothetical protein
MKRAPIPCLICVLPLCITMASAQVPPGGQTGASPPVAYSSISELNLLLSQLEQSSQTTQLDLAKLRIEKWKIDSGSKRQTEANVDSIERNLQSALPEIIAQLRASPEDLTATFKLYRNLDALYDVLRAVAESAGAFGTKDEYQSLGNDLNSFERSRRTLAERLESLAGTKETELTHLRSALLAAQAAAKPAPPPKKVIVDDTEPPKKPPAKKKSAPKPSTASSQPQPQPSQPQTKPQ